MKTTVTGGPAVTTSGTPAGASSPGRRATNPRGHCGYARAGDSPAFVMDANNNVIERTIGMSDEPGAFAPDQTGR